MWDLQEMLFSCATLAALLSAATVQAAQPQAPPSEPASKGRQPQSNAAEGSHRHALPEGAGVRERPGVAPLARFDASPDRYAAAAEPPPSPPRPSPHRQEPEPTMTTTAPAAPPRAALATPTGFAANATGDIAAALTALLADVFALYVKTKNFHWHVSGPHFRDYHLMLDDQGEQIFATTDAIAERVRKIGGTTLRSIGHIARLQRLADNDADYVTPSDMLAELCDDNRTLAAEMRAAHALCDEHGDVASASLLETWIDDAERRTWFLFEASRPATASGR